MSEAAQSTGPNPLTRQGTRILAVALAKKRRQRVPDANVAAWVDEAVQRLRAYVLAHGGMFSMEQARVAIAADLPPITELRTWGRVTQIASADGVIARVPKVYIPAASSNNTPKPAWRRGPNA